MSGTFKDGIEAAAVKVEQSTLKSVVIGSLYNAGWNACCDWAGKAIRALTPPPASGDREGLAWLMIAGGDGAFTRLCFSLDDVRVFFCDALFGSVEDAEKEEIDTLLGVFNDPDNWEGGDRLPLRWHHQFEDGYVAAVSCADAILAAGFKRGDGNG